jgi:hypothetical protein
MELTTEQITSLELSDDQAAKLTGLTNTHEAELKKEWDGKANANAERILDGAAKLVQEKTGITREQGQKFGDYLEQSSNLFFEGKNNALTEKQKELEEKIKNTKGDELLKGQFEELKIKFDGSQKKAAQFDEWEKENYKGKWEQANEKLNNQTKDLAFNSVKPNFPTEINEYEAKGRWKEFINTTLDKNKIAQNDSGDWVAVSKENEYSITKLSDLVKQDKELQTLIEGRKITGLGGDKKEIEIEGVPFKVAENATAHERQNAIKDYLQNVKKINVLSNEYSKEFASLNSKILKKN